MTRKVKSINLHIKCIKGKELPMKNENLITTQEIICEFKNLTIKVNSIFLQEGKTLEEKMVKLIENHEKNHVA